MSLDKWHSGLDEIASLIAADPSKDKAMLLAALYTIQPHLEAQWRAAQTKQETSIEGQPEAKTTHGQLYLDYIQAELNDAEKYQKLWIETKDDQFKEMARDELRHSEYLIKLVREDDSISEAELQDVLVFHNALLARLD